MQNTELEKTLPEVMEPILFVNITAQGVGKQKVGQVLPLMEIIATQNNFKLKNAIDFIMAKKILIESAIFN